MLERGDYPEIDPKGKERPHLDPMKQGDRSKIDPRVQGDRLDIETDNTGEKAQRLRNKFFPGL